MFYLPRQEKMSLLHNNQMSACRFNKKNPLHRVKRPAYSRRPPLCRSVLLSFWVITPTLNSFTAGFRQVTWENWQLEKPSSFANTKRDTASGLNKLTEPQECGEIDSDLTTKQHRASLQSKVKGFSFFMGVDQTFYRRLIWRRPPPVLYHRMGEIVRKA